MLKVFCRAGANQPGARIVSVGPWEIVSRVIVVAIVVGTSFLGCAGATGGGFARLPAAEQDRFRRCTEAVNVEICQGSDPRQRRGCLDAKAETFAARPTERTRSNWLALHGCKTSVMEPAVAALPVAAALPLAGAKPPEGPVVLPPALPVNGPNTSPAPAGGPQPVPAAVEPLPPTPAIAVGEPLVSPGIFASDETPHVVEAQAPATPPAPAVRAPGDLASAPAPTAGKAGGNLRAAIVAHDAEMRWCVDRQLKLVPSLRAEATMVIEVDHTGRVVRAGLRGNDLEGTSLETCLRTRALAWRFPGTRRAYAIEAPLRISGTTQQASR